MRVLVIPCYNEEKRLKASEIYRCVDMLNCTVVLVDDGSTDRTLNIISAIADHDPLHIHVHSLTKNMGKGEAVRQGVHIGFKLGATEIAFCDADFSVDAVDLLRLFNKLDAAPHLDAVIGSRMAISGSVIERSYLRHISGRIFATIVTLILKKRIYDTQCGSKVFRVNSVVSRAFSETFISRWAFDVEVIGRIFTQREHTTPTTSIEEVPLQRWVAQPGSKLTFIQQGITVLELLKIRTSLKKWS